jgi:hypothetical protein
MCCASAGPCRLFKLEAAAATNRTTDICICGRCQNYSHISNGPATSATQRAVANSLGRALCSESCALQLRSSPCRHRRTVSRKALTRGRNKTGTARPVGGARAIARRQGNCHPAGRPWSLRQPPRRPSRAGSSIDTVGRRISELPGGRPWSLPGVRVTDGGAGRRRPGPPRRAAHLAPIACALCRDTRHECDTDAL